MTWFKVDDSFYRSRKVRLLGKDRVPCVGLWTLCGDWAADNLTDGFVPWEVIEDWDPSRDWAKRLIAVALWFETESDGEHGIRFHDWDEWQPTKEQVVQRRKADAERRARWREARRHGVTPNEQADSSPVTSRWESREVSRRDTDVASRQESRPGSVLPDPTRPVPSRKNSSSTIADALVHQQKSRDDIEQLCTRLRDRIVGNDLKPPAITTTWRTHARLLLDRDGRDLDQALRLIDWCQADDFWHGNVLSIPTFRKKYDQLLAKARVEQRRNGGHLRSLPAPLPSDPAAALADLRSRAAAKEAADLIGVTWVEPPQPPSNGLTAQQWSNARRVEFIDAHAGELRAALTERKTG